MDFQEQLRLGADHLSRKDPVMKALIGKHGLPTFRPHRNYYQALVESIISQQLSVKAAASILGRFVDLFNHFPTPADILARDFDKIKSVGLSRPKTNYIRDLAEHVKDGTVNFDHLDSLSNDEIIQHLTQVKGIGVWTVHMFLIFCMGRLDVLAVGDLGVRNALTSLYTEKYNFDHVVKDVEIQIISEQNLWHPYESMVCWYAWRSLENTPALSRMP